MKVFSSVFLTLALLFGLAACTGVETREQRFADTEKRATQGDVAALYDLGLMYEQGYGVARTNVRPLRVTGRRLIEAKLMLNIALVASTIAVREFRGISGKRSNGLPKPQIMIARRLRQLWAICI